MGGFDAAMGRADAETISFLRYRDEMAYALNTVIGNQTTPSTPWSINRLTERCSASGEPSVSVRKTL